VEKRPPIRKRPSEKQDFQTAFLSTNFKGEPPYSMPMPIFDAGEEEKQGSKLNY